MNDAQKIRVAVLAGARSTEHEVSLVSAYNIAKAIDRTKYDVYVIGLSL
ncbi:MAG: D-alanine--D-alanine ligase A, partial [Candidatus Saccharimonadales bacterium]